MAIGDIFKLAVVSSFGLGQACVNTFHYKQLTTFLGFSPVDILAEDWQAVVQPNYLGIMPTSMLLEQLQIRQVSGGELSLDFPVAVGGTGGTGGTLPPMDCALISWRTGLIGRANRGRTYLTAPFESFQDAGTLTTGALDQYQTLADSMILIHDGITGLIPHFQLVIFHTNAADSPEVAQGLVRNLIATQRRRRVGVGV